MAQPNFEIQEQPGSIGLKWSDGLFTEMPYLWLRDNCSCPDCRVEQTSEKKFILNSVPVDFAPDDLIVDGDLILIRWPDGHETRYQGASLRQICDAESQAWTPWKSEFIPKRIDYSAFLNDDKVAASSIRSFVDRGVIVLSNAPTKPGSVDELEGRLGPIREVPFARIHDVEVDPSGYNVAHTSLRLPPHNDFASCSWPPSVQVLYMLVNETIGGESIIVDGWAVLKDLRDEHPDYFDCLYKMPVPFRMFDDETETRTIAPLVRCDVDGNIAAFRFSNQLMQTLNPTRAGVAEFYRAYHELCQRVTSAEHEVMIRLNGGDVLIVHGHRVLHGRAAFEPTGRRHLQDAYFEFENARNHLVVLQRRGIE